MSVSRDEVRRIAELAALEVRDDDVDAVATDLSAIVGLIQQLAAAEGETAPPYQHGPAATPLREDRVVPGGLAMPPEQFAADFAEGFFLAPRPPGVGSDA